jgi:hypothetical protein
LIENSPKKEKEVLPFYGSVMARAKFDQAVSPNAEVAKTL